MALLNCDPAGLVIADGRAVPLPDANGVESLDWKFWNALEFDMVRGLETGLADVGVRRDDEIVVVVVMVGCSTI